MLTSVPLPISVEATSFVVMAFARAELQHAPSEPAGHIVGRTVARSSVPPT